jgi:curved DNA-binding protein CbpA/CheY-like chemotaxis protein
VPGSVLLIVVEKPAQRMLFNRYLGNTQHHLIFASDGEDGFDRFTEVKPDLVIAHVDVPRLDGTILCQLIRQQPRGDTVPYVLLSEEFVDPGLGEARVQVVGADAFLPYPFDRHLLTERIVSLLSFGRPDPSIEQRPLIERSTPEPETPPVLEQVTFRPESFAGAERNLHEDAPSRDLPKRSALAEAADTVVAFVNPYQGGSGSWPDQELHPSEDLSNAAPQSDQHDTKTHIEVIESRTMPFDDPLTHDKPIQLHFEPTVPAPLSPSPQLPRAAAPKILIPDTKTQKTGSRSDAADKKRRELKTAEDPINEPPILDRAAPRLEELPISETRERPETSEKARLIEELPREATPSASERGAKGGVVRETIAAGVRRGLDESQLGKRLVKRVRTMYRLLDEVDYYQLLGVDRDASDEILKRAYFDLSLEFHPDRFFLLRSGDLKEKIYAIYRRVTEAYTVLTDERRRRSYEDGLRGSSSRRASPEIRERAEREILARAPTDPDQAGVANGTAPSSTGEKIASRPPSGRFVPFEFDVSTKDPKARKLVELAKASMKDGDLHSVRLHLHLARAYERDNRDLESVLAKVASKEREGRRGSEP